MPFDIDENMDCIINISNKKNFSNWFLIAGSKDTTFQSKFTIAVKYTTESVKGIAQMLLLIAIAKINNVCKVYEKVARTELKWTLETNGTFVKCSDNINGWEQDCSNSSALAMGLLQSCTKPSIWAFYMYSTWNDPFLCVQPVNHNQWKS